MNRQQRRANGIRGNVRTYTLTDAQITEIKVGAAKEAIEVAVKAMLGLPLIVLRDDFGFGKQRLERFEERLMQQFGCFDEGYIDLETLKKSSSRRLGRKSCDERLAGILDIREDGADGKEEAQGYDLGRLRDIKESTQGT